MELIFTCEIVTFPVLCSLDDLPGAGAGASALESLIYWIILLQ